MLFTRSRTSRSGLSRLSVAARNAASSCTETATFHPEIPLLPVSSPDWDAQVERLLRDEFLRAKYDRCRRLAEKWAYLDEYLPEIIESPVRGATVIDIGPGPGEFLECCRSLGYDVRGVDAAAGEGGMGDAYLELSRLLTQRQGIPVDYCGLTGWLDRGTEVFAEGSVALINSQGSIEQACSHMMAGEPHHEHHDCRRLKWRTGSELQAFFNKVMSVWKSWLLPGGIIFLYANGAENTRAYAKAIERAAQDVGDLELVLRRKRIHKWKKKGASS